MTFFLDTTLVATVATSPSLTAISSILSCHTLAGLGKGLLPSIRDSPAWPRNSMVLYGLFSVPSFLELHQITDNWTLNLHQDTEEQTNQCCIQKSPLPHPMKLLESVCENNPACSVLSGSPLRILLGIEHLAQLSTQPLRLQTALFPHGH
jgi:hypothetical protein